MGLRKGKVTGRIKQAIGAVTGDERLKRDGRRDERSAAVKEKTDGAIGVVRDKVEVASETLRTGRKGK